MEFDGCIEGGLVNRQGLEDGRDEERRIRLMFLFGVSGGFQKGEYQLIRGELVNKVIQE